jgi:hypothetical protein
MAAPDTSSRTPLAFPYQVCGWLSSVRDLDLAFMADPFVALSVSAAPGEILSQGKRSDDDDFGHHGNQTAPTTSQPPKPRLKPLVMTGRATMIRSNLPVPNALCPKAMIAR